MVDTKSNYLLLIKLIQSETTINASVEPFLNYLKTKEERFIHFDEGLDNSDLLEFLRGANRYADEFIFSAGNKTPIYALINTLYENLKQ